MLESHPGLIRFVFRNFPIPQLHPHAEQAAQAAGLMIQSLHGPSGSYSEIIGVRERGGWLYLGSLHETAAGRVPVPASGGFG